MGNTGYGCVARGEKNWETYHFKNKEYAEQFVAYLKEKGYTGTYDFGSYSQCSVTVKDVYDRDAKELSEKQQEIMYGRAYGKVYDTPEKKKYSTEGYVPPENAVDMTGMGNVAGAENFKTVTKKYVMSESERYRNRPI